MIYLIISIVLALLVGVFNYYLYKSEPAESNETNLYKVKMYSAFILGFMVVIMLLILWVNGHFISLMIE